MRVHVTQADVSRRARGRAPPLTGSVRAAVNDFIQSTFSTVEELYRLDRDVGFDPYAALRPEARDFAADRLAAGAWMLGTLWRAAWEEGTR